MGKKGGKKFKGNQDRWEKGPEKTPTEPNSKWIAYYKAQQICSEGEDWASMVATFMQPLPASLRINFDCPYSERLKAELRGFCGKPYELEDGQRVEAVQTLEWFPDGRGFQLGLDRGQIRKSQDPRLKELHQWLIGHTDSGMLTRQEAVSMIPPLVLQVEPSHMVLDMCAAPGSKTTQMLELIQTGTSEGTWSTNGQEGEAAQGSGKGGIDREPTGMVVANDCDTQRSYMLAHQCKRFDSPALVITTHQGQHLPNPAKHAAKKGGGGDSGVYDRVLCDVPCSGDGTIRKQPSIMATWGTHAGQALYALQLSIAMRGVSLTKVGGLLVYSTCSLNPIENEAVVATLLRKANGSIVLEDASGIIPELKRRPGLTSWTVFEEGPKPANRRERKRAEKEQRQAEARAKEAAGEAAAAMEQDETAAASASTSAAEAAAAAAAAAEMAACSDPLVRACLEAGLRHYPSYEQVPEAARKSRVKPGMFPPPAGCLDAAGRPLHLERCMRCVPQDQNTGGFFIALLRKVAPLKPCPATPTAPAADSAGAAAGKAGDLAQEVIEGFDDQSTTEADSKAAADSKAEAPPAKRARTEVSSAGKCKGGGKGGGSVAGSIAEEYYRPARSDTLAPLMEFYGLATTQAGTGQQASAAEKVFPVDQIYSRSSDEFPKSITYLTRTVKEKLIDLDANRDLKIVSTGLKLFEKNSANSVSSCRYRLVQETAAILEPFMADKKRKVAFAPEDLAKLVNRDAAHGGTVQVAGFAPETQREVLALEPGAFLAVTPLAPLDPALYGNSSAKLLVVVWRGRGDGAVNVMASKEALFVVGHRLKDLGVHVVFPEAQSQAASSKEKGGDNQLEAAPSAGGAEEEAR